MIQKPPKPILPTQPYSYQYEERTERIYIYEYIQLLREECEIYDDEIEEKAKEGFSFNENENAWVKGKPISEVNFEWLLSQVPDVIKLSDVKIEFGYHASSMAYEDHHVRFYYEKIIPAKAVEYKIAKAQYDQDLIVYNQAIKDWEETCHQLEIEEVEAKLKKLKGQ